MCYNIVIGKEKYIYILQQVHRDILLLRVKLMFRRLKYNLFVALLLFIKLITIHAGTPKRNKYKKHDKLGCNSICYIGSTNYRYRGNVVKLTYIITMIWYMLTRSAACGACSSHYKHIYHIVRALTCQYIFQSLLSRGSRAVFCDFSVPRPLPALILAAHGSPRQ